MPDFFANAATKVLVAVVVALWSLLMGVVGYFAHPNKDLVLEQRVGALETRIEDRLLEINRRLDELSRKLP